jgi:Fe-S-cluster containining protein
MGGDKRSVDRTPRDFLAAWGRGDAGLVPCGACTACCHYPGIVVDEKRDRKRLAHLLTERSPDGELVLQRRSDGACVHLGEQGCIVYEQRPSVCRTFDCRVFE